MCFRVLRQRKVQKPCKQVCGEQCLSRRSGSTIAIARFCQLSASNSLVEFASSGFKTKKHPFLRMSVFSFMVGPESLLYSYSCKQVCGEQCLSRRSGSTIAIARFCRLSASNSLVEFASPDFKTKKHPFLRMSVFSFMVGPESLLYSYSCKQVCGEQCLSRRSGSTIAIARFCRLSASNYIVEFASPGFKTKNTHSCE